MLTRPPLQMYASISGKRRYTKPVSVPVGELRVLPLGDDGPAPFAWEITRLVGEPLAGLSHSLCFAAAPRGRLSWSRRVSGRRSNGLRICATCRGIRPWPTPWTAPPATPQPGSRTRPQTTAQVAEAKVVPPALRFLLAGCALCVVFFLPNPHFFFAR